MNPGDLRGQELLEDAAWTDAELQAISAMSTLPQWKAFTKLTARLQTQSVGVCLDPAVEHDETQMHRGRISVLAELIAVVEKGARTTLEERDRRRGTKEPT